MKQNVRKAPQVARLLTPPAKVSTAIRLEDFDKDLLNSENVLLHARREHRRQKSLSFGQTEFRHIDFLARQLPYVTDLLDQISESDRSIPYYIVTEEGRRIEGYSTVGDTIQYLKMHSLAAQKNHAITSEFFTSYVIEVLGLHFAVWKKLDFNKIEEFERYQSLTRSQLRQPKRGSFDQSTIAIDLPPLTPEIRFLNKMIEVKREIHKQIRSGILFWPTFAKLKSEDFQDWHLGIKPVSISLEQILNFDGNNSDFFGLAIHDVTNHTVPIEMLAHSDSFSEFKNFFFEQILKQPEIRAEILRKIWFLSTHEDQQTIYVEYLRIKKGKTNLDQSARDLESNLNAFIIQPESNGNGSPILANHLKDNLYFANEASSNLKKQTLAQLSEEVKAAWTIFIKVYRDTINSHFTKTPSAQTQDSRN